MEVQSFNLRVGEVELRIEAIDWKANLGYVASPWLRPNKQAKTMPVRKSIGASLCLGGSVVALVVWLIIGDNTSMRCPSVPWQRRKTWHLMQSNTHKHKRKVLTHVTTWVLGTRHKGKDLRYSEPLWGHSNTTAPLILRAGLVWWANCTSLKRHFV